MAFETRKSLLPEAREESEKRHREIFLFLTAAEIQSLDFRAGYDWPRIIFEINDTKDAFLRLHIWNGQTIQFLADATDESITDLLNQREPLLPAAGANGDFLGHDKQFRKVAWGVLSGKPSTFPPSAHTHPISDVLSLQTELNNRVRWSDRGVANGVASLGPDGKILPSEIAALAITDVFAVSSETEMLGLSAQQGDIARRSDVAKTFILAGTDPAILGNWLEWLVPDDIVQSVNGHTGAVILDSGDVGADPVGTAASERAAHEAEADPHPQYTTPAEASAAAPVQKVNNQTGNVSITTTNIGAVPTSQKAQPNGVATLDSSGQIPLMQIRAFTITDVFVRSSEAAMLALSAGVGDVCIRTDTAQSFILSDTDPSILGNWFELLTYPYVLSVNGQYGVVSLNAGSVGADPSGTAVSQRTAHEAASDPHPQYTTELEAQTRILTIPGHGFSMAGNVPIPVFGTIDGLYSSQADSLDSCATHFVVEVIDTNTIRVQSSGLLSAPGHGLTVGQMYFLSPSTPGAIGTDSQPDGISQPVVYAASADVLILLNGAATDFRSLNKPLVRVENTDTGTNLNVPSGIDAPITGDLALNENPVIFSVSGAGISVSEAGIYRVTASIHARTEVGADALNLRCRLAINGIPTGPVASGRFVAAASAAVDGTYYLSSMLSLSATDLVTVQVSGEPSAMFEAYLAEPGSSYLSLQRK